MCVYIYIYIYVCVCVYVCIYVTHNCQVVFVHSVMCSVGETT
jgi:hypothetical protein